MVSGQTVLAGIERHVCSLREAISSKQGEYALETHLWDTREVEVANSTLRQGRLSRRISKDHG